MMIRTIISTLVTLKKIIAAIRPIPLLIKVGAFSTREQMRNVFIAAAKAGCAGICGLNSISMEVVDAQGNPPLGASRKSSTSSSRS